MYTWSSLTWKQIKRRNKEKRKVGLKSPKVSSCSLNMILGSEWNYPPPKKKQLQAALPKTPSSNEACRAAGGRHFGRCQHHVASVLHNLVMLKIKAALHGHWGFRHSQFPCLTEKHQEWRRCTTEGEVMTRRGYGGCDGTNHRAMVMMTHYTA